MWNASKSALSLWEESYKVEQLKVERNHEVEMMINAGEHMYRLWS